MLYNGEGKISSFTKCGTDIARKNFVNVLMRVGKKGAGKKNKF